MTSKTWLERAKSLVMDDGGPCAVEYAVLLALVIVVAIQPISLLGNKLAQTFANIAVRLPTITDS